MRSESVVITGHGVVSAAGSTPDEVASALARRRDCLAPIRAFETTDLVATHAGEVAGFDPLAWLSPARARNVDRGTQLALAAADQALSQAALQPTAAAAAGIAIGVSGTPQYQNVRVPPDRGYLVSRLGALYGARSTPSFQADFLAHRFGLGGPRFAFGSASLGGFLALAHAMDLLHAGHAPAMLVGGGEIQTLMNALGMNALGVTVAGPCTPFVGRGGICFGEGAAFFVLELRGHAARRDARILAELGDAAVSADAYGEMAQDPSGRGLARAIGKTLSKSGIAAGEIGWVRACGTGHRDLDAAEAIGLRDAFAGTPPPVTSTEPYFSHVNGVSPLLGLVAVVAALAADRAPCLPEPAPPRAGLALTPLAPGPLPSGPCLLTATAFGGTNGAVVVGRPGTAGAAIARPRVTIAIAGIGAVSALGGTAAGLLAGFAHPAPRDHAARRVADAFLAQALPGIPLHRRERLPRMVLQACAEALAGRSVQGSPRFGVLVGLSRGPVASHARFFEHVLRGRFDITTGRILLRTGRFAVASEIAQAFGLLGYSGAMAPGVHGGVHLLAHGTEILRASPDLDGLLVVAADEWTDLLEALYDRLGLLGDGAPYDPRSAGCAGGEGAAAILLTRHPDGARRDGDLAVISGTGFAGDVSARPDPSARAYRRAIAAALDRGAVRPDDITLVVGQGCGWPAHDQREQAALAPLCPNRAPRSILGNTGVAESAGGLFGAIAALGALRASAANDTARGLLIGSTERGAHAALVLERLAA